MVTNEADLLSTRNGASGVEDKVLQRYIGARLEHTEVALLGLVQYHVADDVALAVERALESLRATHGSPAVVHASEVEVGSQAHLHRGVCLLHLGKLQECRDGGNIVPSLLVLRQLAADRAKASGGIQHVRFLREAGVLVRIAEAFAIRTVAVLGSYLIYKGCSLQRGLSVRAEGLMPCGILDAFVQAVAESTAGHVVGRDGISLRASHSEAVLQRYAGAAATGTRHQR